MKRIVKDMKSRSKFIINFLSYRKIYYIVSIVLTVLFCAGLYITEGDLLINFLHAWDNCTLTDFFVIFEATPNSYIEGGIYPPLAYLTVIFLRHFIKVDVCEVSDTIGPKIHQASLMLAIICIIFFVIFSAFICEELLNVSKKEKYLFVFLIFFSIPMLFEIERLNIVFVAWIFLGLFFIWKDSQNAFLREFSYVCLAISAAIKIYPAIFGLLIVFEKRYMDAIRTLIYGVAFFFTPFLYFGGAGKFIDNLIAIVNHFQSSVDFMVESHGNYNISYYAIGDFLSVKMKNDLILPVQIVLFLLVFSSLFLLHSYEKRVLALVCIMIGIPNSSFCYIVIFLIYPIIFFLNRTSQKEAIIYLLFLLMMLYPLPIGYFLVYEDKRQYFWDHVSSFTLQQMFSLVMLHIVLFCDGVYTVLKSRGIICKNSRFFERRKKYEMG